MTQCVDPHNMAVQVTENDDTSKSDQCARAELHLQYGLKLYDDSLARYRALDAKAARSLPTYALILTLAGFLPAQLESYALDAPFLWIVGGVFTAGLFCAVAGMAFLVRAMGTQITAALPNDPKTATAFQTATVSRLSRDAAVRASEAASNVDQASEKKAKAVNSGLQLWIPTMSLILLSVLLTIIFGNLCKSTAA